MGTPAPPPGAKAGLPGVSQAALPRLQASQSREVPGEPGPLKWSPRQAHGAPHLCLKGRRQPLGVVGLWGWWERAEEVRGPSPTLGGRRGEPARRQPRRPSSLHPHVPLRAGGRTHLGVFPEHPLCAGRRV